MVGVFGLRKCCEGVNVGRMWDKFGTLLHHVNRDSLTVLYLDTDVYCDVSRYKFLHLHRYSAVLSVSQSSSLKCPPSSVWPDLTRGRAAVVLHRRRVQRGFCRAAIHDDARPEALLCP